MATPSTAQFDFWMPEGIPVIHATGIDSPASLIAWTPEGMVDYGALFSRIIPPSGPILTAGPMSYALTIAPATMRFAQVVGQMSMMAASQSAG